MCVGRVGQISWVGDEDAKEEDDQSSLFTFLAPITNYFFFFNIFSVFTCFVPCSKLR